MSSAAQSVWPMSAADVTSVVEMDAVDIDSENKDDPKKLPESELSSLSEASSGVEWVPPKCLREKRKRVPKRSNYSIKSLLNLSDEDDDDTMKKIVPSPKNGYNKGSKSKSKTGQNNKLQLPTLLLKKKKQEEAALRLIKKKEEKAALLLNRKQQEEAELLLNKKLKEEAELLLKQKKQEEALLLKKKKQEEALLLKKKKQEEALVLKKKKQEEALLLKKKKQEEALLLNKKKQEEAALLLNKKKQEEAALLLIKKRQEEYALLLNKKKQEEAALLWNKKIQEESDKKKAQENASNNMCSKSITNSIANDNIPINNEQNKTQDEPLDCPFKVGEFLVLKSDIIDHINHPLWRVDGKSLLQKYEFFEKDGKKLYKKSYTYAGWYSKIYNSYVQVKVSTVNYSRTDHIVECLKNEYYKKKLKHRYENDKIN